MSSVDVERLLKPEDWPLKDPKWLKNMFLSQLESIRASSLVIQDANKRLLRLQKENELLLKERVRRRPPRRRLAPPLPPLPRDKPGELPPYLTSEEPYFTLIGEDFLRRDRKELQKITENSLLPDWRLWEGSPRDVPSRDPGLEILSDESFLKRHSKPEVEEVRRKRWDLQSLRAARHTERLKGRFLESLDPPLTSVEPSPETLTHVCVDPLLPVSAFGAPLPRLSPSPFSLKWTSS